MLSICAVIAARNEASYLRILLPVLAEQGIEAAILDHGSTDGSRDLYSAFMGNPITQVRPLDYQGSFSLAQQLEAKRSLTRELRHDWVIHQDADEIFEHVETGSMRDVIEEAAAAGFNAVNFDEFVFLPAPGDDYTGRDFYRGMDRYYFFEPQKSHQHRAWNRLGGFDNVASGGHRLQGQGLKLFPRSHIKRHYMVLSEQHAREKYLRRVFAPAEVKRGWHVKRLNLTASMLSLPSKSRYLLTLDRPDSRDFFTGIPALKHYWDWGPDERI